MATVLKMLLAELHLKSHPDFLSAYDRCAAQLDPPVPPGYGPAKTQFYQWLSGRMVGLPRDYHCRVLAKMFPGWTVERLFQMAEAAPIVARPDESGLLGTDIELGEFLGAEMITSGITLVYPTFELPLRPVQACGADEPPYRGTFGKKVRACAADHRPDVLVVLPQKEVRALLYVFSVLQRHTAISIETCSDRDIVADSDHPYISFGLTCNDCTLMYLETVERPLFTINSIGAEGGSHFERLELTDGSRYDSSADRSVGVIARVRPSPDLHPGRYWIFCAGLGPRGTAGASWYLANSWSLLQRRAGDREFVAVVGVGENSDGPAHLEHMLIERHPDADP
ncbi:hypothetical protein GFY24_32995 [Nocardia sp. SYP-A9097]|uniref:hypothetical protein n=1 Tax=Nocardia sp. SYP-A9097 TaxID=2663237 RepID=UPI00129AC490|nr:hypothetical protein [Nocardia sp. SYP-A9097]MRH92197.1 hypothetical protein [Nocardia sp. SYP-A9097]